MKGSKQSRTDLLEKKVQTLVGVVQQLLYKNDYLKELAVGTLETIKQMPDYEQAIEKLKEKMVEKTGEAKEADTGGKIIE